MGRMHSASRKGHADRGIEHSYRTLKCRVPPAAQVAAAWLPASGVQALSCLPSSRT